MACSPPPRFALIPIDRHSYATSAVGPSATILRSSMRTTCGYSAPVCKNGPPPHERSRRRRQPGFFFFRQRPPRLPSRAIDGIPMCSDAGRLRPPTRLTWHPGPDLWRRASHPDGMRAVVSVTQACLHPAYRCYFHRAGGKADIRPVCRFRQWCRAVVFLPTTKQPSRYTPPVRRFQKRMETLSRRHAFAHWIYGLRRHSSCKSPAKGSCNDAITHVWACLIPLFPSAPDRNGELTLRLSSKSAYAG